MAITCKNKNKDFKKKRIKHSNHIKNQILMREAQEKFDQWQ
jgi:hypothetical protein